MLLGQSVLKRFGKIMIDNSTNTLYIQKWVQLLTK
jgi:hypothetical protein